MTLQNNNKQSFWIQPTKFIAPAITPAVFTRPRLFSLLEQSKHYPITSLQAPAGFGKSTAVAHWLTHEGLRYGWYCCDVNDNRPEYFAQHLLHLLNEVSNGACEQTLTSLDDSTCLDLHSVLASAAIELGAIRQPIYLVFDELDVIHNQQVAQALFHWLKHLPAQLHLLLVWQYELPFSIASFKVKGQINSISAQQLVYTAQELQQLLTQSLNLPADNSDSAALSILLAGWPAAVEFYCQRQRISQNKNEVLAEARFCDIELDDYLIHEVFLVQPEVIQKCLVRLSVFAQFDLAMCEQVIDFADAQSLLAEIQRRQLFLQTQKSVSTLFSFAPVFQEGLQRYLKRVDHQGYIALQQQAVGVYLQQGFLTNAIELCLTLKKSQPVLYLLKHSGLALYQKGQFSQLTQLFDLLNIDDIKQDSELSVLYAWLLLATYRESHVSSLQTVEQPATQIDRDSWAEHAVAQAQAAINAEDFPLAKTLANQAYSQLPAKCFVSRTGCFSVFGQLALCQGELTRAIELLRKAEGLAFEHKLMQQRLWSMCLLSDAYRAKGGVDLALSVQQSALDMAKEHSIEDALHMEYLYRNRIQLQLEQGELSAVDKLLSKSEKVIAPLGRYGQLNNQVYRGMIALWRKQTELACQCARTVNHLLQSHQFHTDWLAHAHDFLLACESMQLLDFTPHYCWHEKQLKAKANNHFYQHYQRTYCRYLWLQGEMEAANNRLEQLQLTAHEYQLTAQSLKNSIQLAIWQNDEHGLAHWQVIAAELPVTKPLLSIWLGSLFDQHKVARSWPQWSVWFFDKKIKTEDEDDQQANLLERLNKNYAKAGDYVTHKELQVFLLIGTGLSNEEISANMHIALSTVKSHIRRLYRKLGITKRSQAVELYKHG